MSLTNTTMDDHRSYLAAKRREIQKLLAQEIDTAMPTSSSSTRVTQAPRTSATAPFSVPTFSRNTAKPVAFAPIDTIPTSLSFSSDITVADATVARTLSASPLHATATAVKENDATDLRTLKDSSGHRYSDHTAPAVRTTANTGSPPRHATLFRSDVAATHTPGPATVTNTDIATSKAILSDHVGHADLLDNAPAARSGVAAPASLRTSPARPSAEKRPEGSTNNASPAPPAPSPPSRAIDRDGPSQAHVPSPGPPGGGDPGSAVALFLRQLDSLDATLPPTQPRRLPAGLHQLDRDAQLQSGQRSAPGSGGVSVEDPSAAADGARAHAAALALELEERGRQAAIMRAQLRRAKEVLSAQAAEAEARCASRLAAQAAESEAVLGRHLSFIDQLLADKAALARAVEEAGAAAAAAAAASDAKLKAAEARLQGELSRAREQWAAAEKAKRAAWQEATSRDVRAGMMRALQPDIQRMLDTHKEELAKVQAACQVSALSRSLSPSVTLTTSTLPTASGARAGTTRCNGEPHRRGTRRRRRGCPPLCIRICR